MKRFKGFLLVGMIVAMLMQASIAMAWYKINIKTGQIIESNSFAMYDAEVTAILPPGLDVMWLDPIQKVANSWDVWFLQDYAYKYTVPIPYEPNKRDCDDIACIYKAVLAYLGYGNAVGIVFDLTMGHAYNCFWLDEEGNGSVHLWAIDPQNGSVWPFDGTHKCRIFW